MRFLLLFFCLFYVNSVCAKEICNDLADGGALSHFYENNYYIAASAEVRLTTLTIDIASGNEVKIENHGLFHPSTMDVCANCHVIFENYNMVSIDSVILNTGAQIFQIVSSKDNMIALDLNVDYTTLVQDAVGLSLADVVDLSDNSRAIVLNNVTLNIDKVPTDKSKAVFVGDNVTFVINDISDGYNSTVLENVTNSAYVRFVSDSSDIMYVNVGTVQDGKLYIDRVRETDYSIILGSDAGDFVNSLRVDDKNDKLMYALDSAVDKNSLYSVMSKSVLFNPDRLLRPLQVINAVNMQSVSHDFIDGLGANVFGVMSDDFYLYGADIKLINVVKDNLKFNLGGQISYLDYMSDIDEFSGRLYGGNIGIGYLFDNNLFVDLNAGMSVAQFDIPVVMFDGEFISKPDAMFGYVVSDAGYQFKTDLLYLYPFIGVGAQMYDVTGNKYNDYMMRFGISSEYKYTMSDLEYVYGASVVADTDSTLSVSGKIGFVSPTDMVGGSISLSVISAHDSLSYKASVNANIVF